MVMEKMFNSPAEDGSSRFPNLTYCHFRGEIIEKMAMQFEQTQA
jgi:hypothetical protein